jgi:hypothetical protein
VDDDAAAGRAALIDASRHVREAAAELAAVLHQLEDVVDEAVVALEAGGSASESYRASGFNAVRDDLFAVQAKFDEAFTMVRAQGVRMAVDQEGASFTEVARLVGRSRQFVTRLYRQAHGRDA